jgi:excisionase family DNA binding protein
MVKRSPQPAATHMGLKDVATFLKISEKKVKALIADGYLATVAATGSGRAAAQFSRAAVEKVQKILPELVSIKSKLAVSADKLSATSVTKHRKSSATAVNRNGSTTGPMVGVVKNSVQTANNSEYRAETTSSMEETLAHPTTLRATAKSISAVEAAAKLILTLEEAAVLTHIPASELRRELKMGRLRGLIRGRGWKIHRSHLDEYVANLYVPKKRLDSFKE